RRDGTDFQALAYPTDQGLDGKIGSGAGTQADDHAILDHRRCGLGRFLLLRIAVHQARTALNTRSQLPAQTLATSSPVMPRARNAAAISAWRRKFGISVFAAPAGRSVPMPTWSMPTASIIRNKWRIIPGSFSSHSTAIQAPIT